MYYRGTSYIITNCQFFYSSHHQLSVAFSSMLVAHEINWYATHFIQPRDLELFKDFLMEVMQWFATNNLWREKTVGDGSSWNEWNNLNANNDDVEDDVTNTLRVILVFVFPLDGETRYIHMHCYCKYCNATQTPVEIRVFLLFPVCWLSLFVLSLSFPREIKINFYIHQIIRLFNEMRGVG